MPQIPNTAPGTYTNTTLDGAATVNLGSISFTNDASYQNIPGVVWDDYVINSYYYKCHQRYMLGISSPTGFNGDTAAFVQLANPTLLWVADWTCATVGLQPPSPSSLGPPGWVLLIEYVNPFMITVMADGVSPAYRLSGTYVYGCRKPSTTLVNDVSFPLPPYLENVFDRNMPAASMQQGMIAPAVPLTLQGVVKK